MGEIKGVFVKFDADKKMITETVIYNEKNKHDDRYDVIRNSLFQFLTLGSISHEKHTL